MHSVVGQSCYNKPEKAKRNPSYPPKSTSSNSSGTPVSPVSPVSSYDEPCSPPSEGGAIKGGNNKEHQQKDGSVEPRNGKQRTRRHSYKERSFLQRILCLLRRLYGHEEEDEDEADEFNIHVTRYRPEELAKLTRTTKFSKREIQLMYRGFKQECPTGLVDEDAFKGIFAQFFPQGDASHYAHYVFNTIKHNKEGQISFEDFLKALSTVSRGTNQEKLQWIFGLYDVNHDGMITKTEMMDVVQAIYEMMGPITHPQVDNSSAKEHVEKIFHLMDSNKDGAITIEELADWVSRDDNIIQSLSMMDTVLYTMKDNPQSSPPSRRSLSTP